MRKHLMQQRAELSQEAVQQGSQHICHKLLNLEIVQKANHIGFYWPVRGEVDVRAAIEALWQQGKNSYLPVLTDTEREMQFYQYDANTKLVNNQFDIPEPVVDPKTHRAVQDLDVVIVPVLSFDAQGHRLGCGCGYYDTSFAFKKQRPKDQPYLLGVAYQWQQGEFEVQPWDVAMDFVITD